MSTYRRPKTLGTVVASINLDGDGLCVDFFQRPDFSYGFEEYRRDGETGEGWFPIGFYSDLRFETLEQARQKAIDCVTWLENEL
ncbi:MAG: hypothetical protein ACR2O8_17415 [Rhizobiaceae bacterium]